MADMFLDSPQAQQFYDLVRGQQQENNLYNRMMVEKQMDFQRSSAREAMNFNHREAELNRNWQAMMSNTAHQRQVKDLVAAGLNPVLSATGGNGAPVGSGATAQGYSNSGASATADTQLVGALTSLFGAFINADVQRDIAELSAATSMRNYEVAADASVASSGLMAAANRYAATMSNEASHYVSDKNYKGTMLSKQYEAANIAAQLAHDTYIHKNFPSNMWQAVAAGLDVAGNAAGSSNSGFGVLNDAVNGLKDVYSTIYNLTQPKRNGNKSLNTKNKSSGKGNLKSKSKPTDKYLEQYGGLF